MVLKFVASVLFVCCCLCFSQERSNAQLLGVTGANHPELSWHELQTDHFVIVYHQGLDSIAQIAAPVAEEVYRVVTTNLKTGLSKKVRIYLSDNDETRNAFAFQDHYIFIWMRGILDDNLFTLRSSGTSKWLRTVITHEFTHIVIDHATSYWLDLLFPGDRVPRWFNEGMARYMEPDGWTDDLDVPLRVAAVDSKLHLGWNDFLAGTFIYEGGQSLVRYIAWKYGDSALVKILHPEEESEGINVGHRLQLAPYDFGAAVKFATKHPLEDVYEEWHKTLNVYYNTEYGQKEDIQDVSRRIGTGLKIVAAARLAPDGKRIAIYGKRSVDEAAKLFLLAHETSDNEIRLLTGEPGIEPYLSWSPDGKKLLFSKVRFGDHGNFIYDLFTYDPSEDELERLTSNARLEYPDFSPDGKTIVASQFERSGSDLVLLDANGQNIRKLTHFGDDDVDVTSPRWSPDGKRIAFSIFRKNGMRDVATIDVASQQIAYLTNDSINDRYPIWSGDSILFLSYQNGLPNLYITSSHNTNGRNATQLTDAASNVLAWDATKDSILVSSFTARNSIALSWLPLHREAKNHQTPSLPVKYTAWRTASWPLVTRPVDSLPQTIAVGPYGYSSLAHIRPLLFLPLISSDMARDGSQGTQWGATMVFMDEMQKHLLQIYGLYGDASNAFSYGGTYVNNQLWPNIILSGSNRVDFKDVIADKVYYEHSKQGSLGINFGIHTSNSLTKIHDIFVSGEWAQYEPWNTRDFAGVDSTVRPVAFKWLNFTAGYSFLSPLFQAGFNGEYGSGDFSRTRLRGFVRKEFPFGEDEHDQVAFIGHLGADFGDEIPQDFLGFYKYDQFEGGYNVAALHGRDRLRGIRRYVYGNRLVTASAEIRQRDKFFSDFLPILKSFEPQFVEFFDIGSVWYDNAPANRPSVPMSSIVKQGWLKTAGVELRSELGFDFSLEGGVGWELVKHALPDWFFRVSADL